MHIKKKADDTKIELFSFFPSQLHFPWDVEKATYCFLVGRKIQQKKCDTLLEKIFPHISKGTVVYIQGLQLDKIFWCQKR